MESEFAALAIRSLSAWRNASGVAWGIESAPLSPSVSVIDADARVVAALHEEGFDLVGVCAQSLAQLHHGDGACVERVAEEPADVSAVDPAAHEVGRGPAHRRHRKSVLEFPVVTLKPS